MRIPLQGPNLSLREQRIWLEHNLMRLARLAVIPATVFMAYFMATRLIRVGRPDLVIYHPIPLAIVGLFVSIAFLHYPALGLVALVAANFFVNVSIGTGTGTSINASVLLVGLLMGLWVLDMVARQKKIQIVASRTIPAITLFMIIPVLSFLAGLLPWYVFAQHASIASQLGGLAVFTLSAFAYLLTAHRVPSLRWLEILTYSYLGLGSLYAVMLLIPSFRYTTLEWFYYGGFGALYWTWIVAMASSQALLNRKLDLPWRIALGALVLLALYIGLFTQRSWKSGWVPPLIALGAVIWLGIPRMRGLFILGAVIVLIINSPMLYGLLTGSEGYSILTRLEAWRIMGEIVKVNPLLGLGPANYYFYTPLFSILGYNVNFNSHNNYVDIIAQTGLLGLLAVIWVFVETGALGWRLRKHVPEGFAPAYIIGVLGGMVGSLGAGMLGDWLLPFVYNIGLPGFRSSVMAWVFMGGLVALEQLFVPQVQHDRHGNIEAVSLHSASPAP